MPVEDVMLAEVAGARGLTNVKIQREVPIVRPRPIPRPKERLGLPAIGTGHNNAWGPSESQAPSIPEELRIAIGVGSFSNQGTVSRRTW